MRKALVAFALLAVMMGAVAGCAPGPVAQVNTPVPGTPGTPAPSGQINVPGVTIQVNAPGPEPAGQYRAMRVVASPASCWDFGTGSFPR